MAGSSWEVDVGDDGGGAELGSCKLLGRCSDFEINGGAILKSDAIDPQILDDALDVVARLGAWNPFHPIDRVDIGIARITVQLTQSRTRPRPAL
jgi:hypothetical protein